MAMPSDGWPPRCYPPGHRPRCHARQPRHARPRRHDVPRRVHARSWRRDVRRRIAVPRIVDARRRGHCRHRSRRFAAIRRMRLAVPRRRREGRVESCPKQRRANVLIRPNRSENRIAWRQTPTRWRERHRSGDRALAFTTVRHRYCTGIAPQRLRTDAPAQCRKQRPWSRRGGPRPNATVWPAARRSYRA